MSGLPKQIDHYGPIFLTFLLIVWTGCVYRFSQFGDNWAILPALLILPSAVIWHCVLIAHNAPKAPFIIYAAAHLTVLMVVWVICLMLISKSSL